MKLTWAQQFGTAGESSMPAIAPALRITAIFLRSAFICALGALILRVSMPQTGTLWQIYDTPSDAVRLVLAICACVWLASQLFRLPRDASGYRTWLVLGIFAVPFVVICLVAVW